MEAKEGRTDGSEQGYVHSDGEQTHADKRDKKRANEAIEFRNSEQNTLIDQNASCSTALLFVTVHETIARVEPKEVIPPP